MFVRNTSFSLKHISKSHDEKISSESPDDRRFSSQYLNHAEENPDAVVLETTDDFFCRKRTFNKTQQCDFSF